jgi:hypothetical protein
MAITRANVEAILVRRVGKKLTAAGLDGTTVTGANADLNDPIGWALRQAGYAVASIVAVADADLANVAIDDTDKILDLAELRTLESVHENLNLVDFRLGPRAESLSQLAEQVEKEIARKRSCVQREYGMGLGSISGGAISLEFQETYPETDE